MVRSRRRYFIRATGDTAWTLVTKEQFVRHERNAGFHNTMGQPDEPAKSSFSSSTYEYEGRVEYGDRDPNNQ